MTEMVNYVCEQHENPFDCPDNLIFYSSKFDEYGIIVHDGSTSFIEISFCPWCGTKLPMSKRDLWFDTLEKLGYDDPFEQDIPQDFNSNKWYNK
ncbi:MAG: hypothetical protein ABS939_23085 [Psychrobacillus sp.]